jgi:superfamily I DNA/RNA helicase
VTAERCRWHEDPGGRCGDPAAFPASDEAPPFCARHLLQLEPWIRSRAAQGATAEHWIAHMRRRAGEALQLRRALGGEPPLYRAATAARNNANGDTA